ncbi:hypothetical protein EJB05_06639, partial [Eragrostis curvula]
MSSSASYDLKEGRQKTAGHPIVSSESRQPLDPSPIHLHIVLLEKHTEKHELSDAMTSALDMAAFLAALLLVLTLPPTGDVAPVSPTLPTNLSASATPAERRHHVGSDDWSQLLEPLDSDLRAKLLKYGDLVQATYDGFDGRHWSPHCGSCLHGLRRLLPALGLAGHGYRVTTFVYATSDVAVPHWLVRPLHAEAWEGHANWIGYVAVDGAAEARRAGYRRSWSLGGAPSRRASGFWT